MKIVKKTSVSGDFARKGQDMSAGDFVTIKNEGDVVEGQWGEQYVFAIELADGRVMNANFNRTTLNILHDEFGDDTVGWVGKKVIIRTKKMTLDGKKVEAFYFVTPEWDFDDFGELVKSASTINPEDVPF